MLFRVFSEEEVIEYARQDGYDLGVKEGEERGIRKGIKEGAVQTARGFKAEGISFDIISKCTGLTIEEVEAL